MGIRPSSLFGSASRSIAVLVPSENMSNQDRFDTADDARRFSGRSAMLPDLRFVLASSRIRPRRESSQRPPLVRIARHHPQDSKQNPALPFLFNFRPRRFPFAMPCHALSRQTQSHTPRVVSTCIGFVGPSAAFCFPNDSRMTLFS